MINKMKMWKYIMLSLSVAYFLLNIAPAVSINVEWSLVCPKQTPSHNTSQWYPSEVCQHGPLTRYVKSRVAHAPGRPGTFFPPPNSKETTRSRSRHASRHVRHARVVMHAGIANPLWRGKRSRHFRGMRNPQFYVSGKSPFLINCGMFVLAPYLLLRNTISFYRWA